MQNRERESARHFSLSDGLPFCLCHCHFITERECLYVLPLLISTKAHFPSIAPLRYKRYEKGGDLKRLEEKERERRCTRGRHSLPLGLMHATMKRMRCARKAIRCANGRQRKRCVYAKGASAGAGAKEATSLPGTAKREERGPQPPLHTGVIRGEAAKAKSEARGFLQGSNGTQVR